MRKFKLTVSYDGTHYAGWQIQSNAESIQALLERALSMIAGSEVRVVGSGRTDASVWASPRSLQLGGCQVRRREYLLSTLLLLTFFNETLGVGWSLVLSLSGILPYACFAMC